MANLSAVSRIRLDDLLLPLGNLRATANWLKRINVIWVVQSPLQKYFASPDGANHLYKFVPSRPTQGAYRDRHERVMAWDAVDAAAFCAQGDRRAGRKTCERSPARGREMLQRTAKSCGPDAPTLASSFAEFKSALVPRPWA